MPPTTSLITPAQYFDIFAEYGRILVEEADSEEVTTPIDPGVPSDLPGTVLAAQSLSTQPNWNTLLSNSSLLASTTAIQIFLELLRKRCNNIFEDCLRSDFKICIRYAKLFVLERIEVVFPDSRKIVVLVPLAIVIVYSVSIFRIEVVWNQLDR